MEFEEFIAETLKGLARSGGNPLGIALHVATAPLQDSEDMSNAATLSESPPAQKQSPDESGFVGTPAQELSRKFDTKLSPSDEISFNTWKSKYAPNDSGADYDLRGAFKAGLRPDPETGHWPDTFKKPNHPTFSDESKYAAFGKPGHWEGNTFIPAGPLNYHINHPTPEGLAFAYNHMANSKDLVDKIEAASAVQEIAHQLIAFEMPKYHDRAQVALGVDLMNQQVMASMLADVHDPANPHDGTWSSRTEALMGKKAALLAGAIQTAKEYSILDPKYNAPLVAADAVLKSAGLLGVREDRARKASDHAALVNSITDTEAQSYAFIIGQQGTVDWTSPSSVFNFKAAMLPDKEFQKLSQTGLLSLNDGSLARNLYADARDPVSKSRVAAVVARMEATSQGIYDPGITKAERAMRQFKAKESLDLFQKAYNTTDVPPQFKKAFDKEVGGTAIISDPKEKNAEIRKIGFKFKDRLLQEYLTQKFTSDVSVWSGIDLADPTVSAALLSAQKASGHKTVTLDEFAAAFLYQNDGTNLPAKVLKLQSYIKASAVGASTSAILPSLDGDSISKSVAPGMIRRIWEDIRK